MLGVPERRADRSHLGGGLISWEIWRLPFTVPLTGHELRGGDALAVRVKNTDGMGGVWKPVHLIAKNSSALIY